MKRTIGVGANQSSIKWDEQQEEAWAKWVKDVSWQAFATLTFPWKPREDSAQVLFKQFINDLERNIKTRICYVSGMENTSTSREVVPWHFHCAMAAQEVIPLELIETTWRTLIDRSETPGDDSVLVRPYDHSRPGIQYITKMATQPGVSPSC